jgi:hypothetical protein
VSYSVNWSVKVRFSCLNVVVKGILLCLWIVNKKPDPTI